MKRLPFLSDVLELFFPHVCRACGEGRPLPDEPICLSCLGTLPFTRFHVEPENPFTELFWGRVPIRSGTAMFYFRKSGRVQQLVHELKYKGKKEIGLFLGSYYGRLLKEVPVYQSVDAIVPVPLHRRKHRSRGYNQSEQFALGLSEELKKPVCTGLLHRHRHTNSQTKMGRWDRLENVGEAFTVQGSEGWRNKHLLLVDDILTTGATLEACASRLLEVPGVEVSMATIGFAR